MKSVQEVYEKIRLINAEIERLTGWKSLCAYKYEIGKYQKEIDKQIEKKRIYQWFLD